MPPESHDPRDIPILTDVIADERTQAVSVNSKDAASAIVSETLKLGDSLLHQAIKDIEATLFERVLDRLRAELPELVARTLAEHTVAPPEGPDHG
jgi:hypothetical protein